MGSRGDCYDNALIESFWHTLKVEAINGCPPLSRFDMKQKLFSYIEDFYNKQRTHSALGLESPLNFEHNYHNTLAA
jgi:putative transposase